LARGYFDEVTLANIHNLMNAMVEEAGGRIDVVCYCPHHPNDACECRKPLPGLLNQIEQALDISVADAWYVGDTLKDIQAARNKSCKPILVRSGKGSATEARLSSKDLAQVPVFDNLAEAASYILAMDSANEAAAV
jgi:D-glycero-D-manno-heptose 1,7-bisphosphate phosphatase